MEAGRELGRRTKEGKEKGCAPGKAAGGDARLGWRGCVRECRPHEDLGRLEENHEGIRGAPSEDWGGFEVARGVAVWGDSIG